MENIYHEKEEEGVFYGGFSYITEGMFSGSYEAKCSQACVNMVLQKSRFIDGLAVCMDEQALFLAIEALHIRNYFGLSDLTEMENLFLVNWREGQLELFGSLLAIYQVLKAEGLGLLPFSATLHPVICAANSNPEKMKGYLYFLEDHWRVFRQLGKQWYKLDPWLGGPQLVTHFYASLYIKQLLADGKLVFIIEGDFPACPADLVVQEQDEAAASLTEVAEASSSVSGACLYEPGKNSVDLSVEEINESLRFLDLVFDHEDNELALALLLSLEDDHRRKRENEEFIKMTSLIGASETDIPWIRGGMASRVTNVCETISGADPSEITDFIPVERERRVQQALPAGGSETQMIYASNLVNSPTMVKRRNGTTVNPLMNDHAEETVLNTSNDPEDFSGPFNIMFKESGEGARCLSSPASPSSGLDTVSSNPLISPPREEPSNSQRTTMNVIPSAPTNPNSYLREPYITSAGLLPSIIVPRASPKVYITTSETSSMRKELPVTTAARIEGEEQEEELCCICWMVAPSHVVVPCGHFCLCELCVANILHPSGGSHCPVCKQSISTIIKLFKV